MRPFVRLFKDGDQMAIQTNCTDESDFISIFSSALSDLIEEGVHDSDWAFQLEGWLPRLVDIASKLRGYKADVQIEQTITAGPTYWKSSDACKEAWAYEPPVKVPEPVA